MIVSFVVPPMTLELACRVRDQMTKEGIASHTDYAIVSVKWYPPKDFTHSGSSAEVEIITPAYKKMTRRFDMLNSSEPIERFITLEVTR